MPETGVISRSKFLDPKDFAFAVEAVRIQLERDVLPAWRQFFIDRGLDPELWPVVGYDDIPADQPVTPVNEDAAVYPIACQDDIKTPGADGFHDYAGGAIYGRVQINASWTITLSHEGIELRCDAPCNRWEPMPGRPGKHVALEPGDPVENDTYLISVTLFGETRQIPVSNFALPNWFVEGSAGPWDFMGLCKHAGDNRGYVILQDDATGDTENEFAKTATDEYKTVVGAKLSDRNSRTHRRHGSALGGVRGVMAHAPTPPVTG